MDRRTFVRSAALLTGASVFSPASGQASHPHATDGEDEIITINPGSVKGSFPHFWEECIGSDRASVGLRAQWLADLDLIHKRTGMKQVRFHGLFSDEMGVWPTGAKAPNFLYVDMVFDAMMERGVKPFVELGFMPSGLASGPQTVFFYKANITPPKDMSVWGELVRTFVDHVVRRYGIAEVSTWSFEVWNEANLPFFWSGKKEEYLELYREAALAVKSVDAKLRVGGPATARAAWIPDLLDYCANQNVPIDFVSTHIYPDDPQKILFGPDIHYPFEEVIPRVLSQVKAQITASRFPHLPLYISEWSSQNPAFIAHTIKGSAGLADVMSYWTFDSVYEELGLPKTFMNSSFGLIGLRGVPRPSFHTFALLHRLGDFQIEASEGPLIATRRKDGSLSIVLWNLVPQPPGQRSSTGDPAVQTSAQFSTDGAVRRFTVKIQDWRRHSNAQITRVDQTSGTPRKVYEAMGSPPYPTSAQLQELKNRSEMAPPQSLKLDRQGILHVDIPPNGVALIELS